MTEQTTIPSEYLVRTCRSADREHVTSCRQYAHVFHKPGVICVTESFWLLPRNIQYALLLHEIGHLLLDGEGSEQDANRATRALYGIKIHYRDTPFGDSLEWIDPRDTRKAAAVLGVSL